MDRTRTRARSRAWQAADFSSPRPKYRSAEDSRSGVEAARAAGPGALVWQDMQQLPGLLAR
ncbi:hypothetical protein [Streptomyces xanthophaeus]|uniref:hypothetical protein n=1 Tax=Streptomyces xanthophaeus TaxID=67385 RepID=UPI00233F537F|nr:hypothetical protein [Streptomyces xanthophaeus]